jgi:hypothetical protein
MSNRIHVKLDALASTVEEINKIEPALKKPCEELVTWVAERDGQDPKKIAENLKTLVAFTPTANLGAVDPLLNTARRFVNDWKDRFWGIVWSHLNFVSRDFPKAIFLAEYWEPCSSFSGKKVLRGGREVRSIRDGNQRAQGYDWALPDIFAPYRAEYHNGAECGSLWDQWLSEMQGQLSDLKAYYAGPNVAEQDGSIGGQS